MFYVVQPPKEETEIATIGKELFDAALALGMKLDREGFLFAWISGTRVIIERNADNTIVSIAFLAVGKKWTKDDFNATLLELRGNEAPMMEFIKQICAALGARTLFVEQPNPVVQGKLTVYTVHGYELQ